MSMALGKALREEQEQRQREMESVLSESNPLLASPKSMAVAAAQTLSPTLALAVEATGTDGAESSSQRYGLVSREEAVELPNPDPNLI